MTSSAVEGVQWPELVWARRAIVVADVVESVRLIARGEADFIDRWRRFVNDVRSLLLPTQGGRLVKSLGDGLLLEFADVPCAIDAALQMRERVAGYNVGCDPQAAIRLRTGIHVAEIVVDDLDVWGAGVNLAARLASLGRPDDIVLSTAARDAIVSGVHARLEDMGECFVKNLEAPVRAFRILADATAVPMETPAQPPPGATTQLSPRVAVVPLRCLSTDPTHRAVGDAVADDIIAALSRAGGITVLSRLSTAALRDADSDLLSMAGKSLQATYVLQGSQWVRGERVHIRAELAEVGSGEVIWSDSIDASLDDLFAGADAAIPAIAAAVGRAVLSCEVRRVGCLPMPNLASYTLYLGGVSLLHRLSRHDFSRAHELLEHVAERVPRSAAPHAMLAKWHVFQIVQGWSRDRTHQGAAARDEARRALDRDPQDALSLAVDGLTSVIVDADLEGAEAAYRRAVEANPQEPYAWSFLSGLHTYCERPAEALAAAERAIELSPVDPSRFLFEAYRASALILAGRQAEAAASARESLRLNAMHTPSHRLLIIALALAGDLEGARAAVAQHMRLDPAFSVRAYRERYPGRHTNHAERYAEALRLAGIPE